LKEVQLERIYNNVEDTATIALSTGKYVIRVVERMKGLFYFKISLLQIFPDLFIYLFILIIYLFCFMFMI
jgi:hypothetical protein